MPVGPNGEKRPSDPVSAAAMVVRIATGQMKDPKTRRAGGLARSEALTPERRSEIARKAARARWSRRNGAAAEA